MKTKLLKKLRKQFEIQQEGNLFYLVDNKSLHWDDTYPYRYMPDEDLSKVRNKRRNEILKTLPRKIKILE